MANQMAYLKTNVVVATHLAVTASFNNIYVELAASFNIVSGSYRQIHLQRQQKKTLEDRRSRQDQPSPSFLALDVLPLAGNPSSRMRT